MRHAKRPVPMTTRMLREFALASASATLAAVPTRSPTSCNAPAPTSEITLSGDIGGAGHKRHYDPSTRSPTSFRKPLERLSNRAVTSHEVDGCQMSPAEGYPMSPDNHAGSSRAPRLRR